MSQEPQRRGRAAWLAAEFVVVMLGVAAGLAVDEWRGGRADRAIEIGYLERLKANVEVDTLLYRSGAEVSLALATRLGVFLDQVDGRAPFPDDHVSFLTGFSAALHADIGGPVRDAYEELLNQGDLGRITDAHVRSEITRYYGEKRLFIEMQGVEWQENAMRVEVLAIERLPADLYRWIQGVTGPRGTLLLERQDWTPTPERARELLRIVRADDELRNQLFRQQQIVWRMGEIYASGYMGASANSWMSTAVALLQLLDEELAQFRG